MCTSVSVASYKKGVFENNWIERIELEAQVKLSSQQTCRRAETYLTTLLAWSIFIWLNLLPARISASRGGLTRTATLMLSFLFPPVKLLILLFVPSSLARKNCVRPCPPIGQSVSCLLFKSFRINLNSFIIYFRLLR